MQSFSFHQNIQKLDKQRGGYYYLTVDAGTVNQWENKRKTRLICEIDHELSYSCGLNHLGDGNYFIIVSAARIKKLGKEFGDQVSFRIWPDPNPLGVEEPEVLQVFLAQDEMAQKRYSQLTDGKKRSLIYAIMRLKSVDKQVQKIMNFLAI